MTALTVSEAIQQRGSVRAYTDQAVSRETIEEILELARWVPSNGNLQPWKVHVLTGDKKKQLSDAVFAKMGDQPQGEETDVRIYPKGVTDPWRARRTQCGETMYTALGIEREDKMGRLMQVARNFAFFDAPVGMIFTVDKSMVEQQYLDVGILLQSIMLLAQERGLSTCPQAAWSMWPETIRKTLCLPDSDRVVVGLAMGYVKEGDKAAHIQQQRVSLQEYVSLHGFD
ncbi:MAG: nitroreductase [Gammaproteobacteria bacterium]|nr:nitroreductase [Gammaproteobacteria bacterium]NND39588.1 nitroreductase [Pseudomonadales bacterium]NNL11368.1 nitroreductase [Pseudomonadales bacterium]NNM11807.1 nitroreductase [Pseudomonadales bacterium]RZV50712.1 MAG: nitroreductase [Pseudomonadales bacterium]